MGKAVAAGSSTELSAVAELLGFAPQHIYALVAISDQLYHNVEVPKRSGSGTRSIEIPKTQLKGVQRAILRNILDRHTCHPAAVAYIRGTSLVETARKLCGDRSVLKLDLNNFFPSITSIGVFGVFRRIGFSPAAAKILMKLTTLRGALSQGSPTSPSLSNLYCAELDREIHTLSISWGLTYYRYSDDMFFCTNGGYFSWIKDSASWSIRCSLDLVLVEMLANQDFITRVSNGTR